MNISRRKAILAGGLASVAPVIGATQASANVAPPMSASDVLAHPLMQNVYNAARTLYTFDGGNFSQSRFSALIIRMNAMLIEKHGQELFPDPALYMTGPVDEINGKIVEAKARKYSVRWEGVDVYSKTALCQDKNANVISSRGERAAMEAVVHDIYHELKNEMAANPGVTVCPYVPITSSGAIIDPMSKAPVMMFMTRYGTSV